MEKHLSTPAVHVDLDIAERNIHRAVTGLAAVGVAHRPHIKVHKSVHFAKTQLAMGCKGITCAKLGEAEVMADGGITDILLAFPMIGPDKLERYGALASRPGLTLRTIINSLEGARGLSALGEKLGRKLQVLVEIDGGINRGGIRLDASLEEYASAVKALPGIAIVGVEYYGGDIYGCKTREEIRLRARREGAEVVSCAERLRALGLCMDILSAGSSFSLMFPEELKGITEVRAGNYIFNDGALLSLGLVSVDDCALRVRSTVVSRQDANHAIIDAGSKTLTSDRVGGWDSFGCIAGDPAIEIYKLNEEHGFLQSKQPIPFKVGDVISVIPNHSCVVPNLADEVYGMRNGKFEELIKIDARGRNR
jgi:D-serine deaminase-like pyridoxal phosphate-dependent protein